MRKPACIAVQERLDTFYRNVLCVSDEDIEDRTRVVATHVRHAPRPAHEQVDRLAVELMLEERAEYDLGPTNPH